VEIEKGRMGNTGCVVTFGRQRLLRLVLLPWNMQCGGLNVYGPWPRPWPRPGIPPL
jgi:hypothetical protein